jgi:hypothetical protein
MLPRALRVVNPANHPSTPGKEGWWRYSPEESDTSDVSRIIPRILRTQRRGGGRKRREV